jgi:hypothetical protein
MRDSPSFAPTRGLAPGSPFDERPGLDDFTRPAPADAAPYVTFCGT